MPNITIIPNNPVTGGTYQTVVNFLWPDTQQSVIDGTQILKITLSGYPVVNQENPLCENVPCPIVVGWNNHSWDGNVPTGVHGNVIVNENWKKLDGSSILCFSVSYSI